MTHTHPMRRIYVEKVTLNMGVGESGERLENAATLLERITGRKPMKTKAHARNQTWKIKKGENIGVKVTVRGAAAVDLLKRALDAVGHKIKARSFDKEGNFSFGVHEYIDFPGIKYDPKIGIVGFDVCVTLARPGFRVRRRASQRVPVGKNHRITKEEAIAFMKKEFQVEVIE